MVTTLHNDKTGLFCIFGIETPTKTNLTVQDCTQKERYAPAAGPTLSRLLKRRNFYKACEDSSLDHHNPLVHWQTRAEQRAVAARIVELEQALQTTQAAAAAEKAAALEEAAEREARLRETLLGLEEANVDLNAESDELHERLRAQQEEAARREKAAREEVKDDSAKKDCMTIGRGIRLHKKHNMYRLKEFKGKDRDE